MDKETKEKPKTMPDTSNVDSRGLREDEIITRLVPNPNDPPDVIMMVGFLGRSTRPRFWRLYRTLDLKDYVEIAEGDIVLTEPLETKLQPLGGTAVWVKSGARLQHTQSESQLAESEFLQGDITKCFLTTTAMPTGALSPAAIRPRTWGLLCISSGDPCTWGFRCRTPKDLCGPIASFFICPSD